MKILVYTAPARGHLFPTVPILLELQRRGHEVVIRTIAAEVAGLRALGFTADAVDPAINAVELLDFKEHNPLSSLKAGVANFIARGELQVPEVQQAIQESGQTCSSSTCSAGARPPSPRPPDSPGPRSSTPPRPCPHPRCLRSGPD